MCMGFFSDHVTLSDSLCYQPHTNTLRTSSWTLVRIALHVHTESSHQVTFGENKTLSLLVQRDMTELIEL